MHETILNTDGKDIAIECLNALQTTNDNRATGDFVLIELELTSREECIKLPLPPV